MLRALACGVAILFPFGLPDAVGHEVGHSLKVINIGPQERLSVFETPGGIGARQDMPGGTNMVVAETCRIVLGYHFPWCMVRLGSVRGWVNSYYLSGQ